MTLPDGSGQEKQVGLSTQPHDGHPPGTQVLPRPQGRAARCEAAHGKERVATGRPRVLSGERCARHIRQTQLPVPEPFPAQQPLSPLSLSFLL